MLKNAALAYLAAILVIGGLVTALTAPKKEEEEKKAKEAKADAALAATPSPEITQQSEIVARVQNLRGIKFDGAPPKLEMAPPQMLTQQLTTLDTQAESQAKGEEKQRDTKLKTATGVVLAQAGALSSKEVQQAGKQYSGPGAPGIWVPQQNKVLVSQELGESDPERAELVYVHELARALEAQEFGQTGRFARPFHDDEAAELALQEGTAELTADEYAEQYLKSSDTDQPLALEAASDRKIAPALGTFVLFPSDDGAKYVKGLYDQGQWDAVNEAHDEMPVTTREILHPDSGSEQDVPPPTLSLQEALGPKWQRQAAAQVGELDTIAMLRAGLQEDEARKAADGWRAGQMENWGQGSSAQQCPPPCRDKTTTAIVWRWDTPEDATNFGRAMRKSLERAALAKPEGGRSWTFKDGGAAFVRSGRFTSLVFAPTAPQAGKVAQAALNA